MPREKGAFSSTTYEATRRDLRGASVTLRAEQRAQRGEGLDRLVNAAMFDCGRLAQNYHTELPDGTFLLAAGPAIPVDSGLDCTGSMGRNVQVAFDSLPRRMHLLAQAPGAPLSRYQAQIATSAIQDVSDQFPFQHSPFEPDDEIIRQLGLFVPESGGGDAPEDYQLYLWYAAYRIGATINNYGLKGYSFIVGDEIGRTTLDETGQLMKIVFGDEANNLLRDHPVTRTEDIARDALEKWHMFYLQVGDNPHVTSWWADILGAERVIVLPRTEHIPEIQAALIGLTEGVFDLHTVEDYLREVGQMTKTDAARVKRAVSHIHLRAQANLPGFDTVPLAGAIFASRTDVWPIEAEFSEATPDPARDIAWQL